MNTDTFLNNFATIAEAPEGIAQVRKIVRRLALTGKTTSQETTDEPVSDLQERLTQHQQNETSQARKKKATKVEIVPRFEVPGSWMWVSIEDIASHQLGKTLNKKTMAGEPVRYLRSVNIQHTGLDLEDLNEMLLSSEDREKFSVRKGDLFVVEGGHAGRCAIFDSETQEELAFQNQLHRLRTRDAISTEFLQLILREAWDSGELQERSTGMTIKHLSSSALRSLPCPLPPLEEQERIVTKVNELLILCDQLEQQQNHRQQTTTKTRTSILTTLTSAESAEDVRKAWSRTKSNIEIWLKAPEAISETRQAIRQLAIRGELVDRRPSDGSVAEFFDQLQSRRKRTSLESKPESNITGPLPIPKHWQWSSFEEVAIFRDGERKPLSKAERSLFQGPFPYYGASGVIDSVEEWLFDETLLLIGEDGANLVNRNTPIAFIAKGQYWVNNHAHVIESVNQSALEYLAIYINSIDLKPYLTGTAQPKLNQRRMKTIPVPIPPLEEQERIVTKVSELLNLCDQLENQLQSQEEIAERLVISTTKNLGS